MTGVAHRARHLTRRLLGSLSRGLPDAAELELADRSLLPAESSLWHRFGPADQRHALLVARRFLAMRPDASRPEVAGALLHDIGKLASGLGTAGRVVATLVGPRTARLRRYHDHEQIGAAMLRDVGSDPVTVELVQGRGAASAALRAADDV